MRKLYGILNSKGELHQDWSRQPWLSQDFSVAKDVARAANGKAVQVKVVICTPKRAAAKSALNEDMTMAAKPKVAPKKVAPKPVGRGKPKGARVSPRKTKSERGRRDKKPLENF